jgi:hypothetical protein
MKPQYLGIGKTGDNMIEPVTRAIFIRGLFTKKTAVKSLAFGFWLVIFALIIYFGFMLWQKIMQATESYHQEARQITNYEWTLEPHQTFFGCNRFLIQTPKDTIKREGTEVKRIGTQKK